VFAPAPILSIDDLRKRARRRLPRIVFDVIESGVEDEHGLARNESAFRQYALMPRYFIDVTRTMQATPLLGEHYDCPFGIAPTGFAGLFREGADLMLARSAAAARIPFILSGASVEKLEAVAKAAPGHAWYHLYPARDPSITADLLARAERAGFTHLVITVDNPVYPNRERDTRNGFGKPWWQLRPSLLAEALTHPSWLIEYIARGGMPVLQNWLPYAGAQASGLEVARFFRSQSPSVQTWRDLEALRRRWHGKLIVKGIQHPDDARRATDLGVDGIIVSNHGGKSCDRLPSPLDTLPGVVAAVGSRTAVMFDSGIRRGADIVVAACLGAQFSFVGRATLYGVAALGEPGVERAIAILRNEIASTLALIGCPDFAALSQAFLVRESATSDRTALQKAVKPTSLTLAKERA
jgi:L-lactate dehydrogenase (cytochrome)/(S)-mandelate dehydrogenase